MGGQEHNFVTDIAELEPVKISFFFSFHRKKTRRSSSRWNATLIIFFPSSTPQRNDCFHVYTFYKSSRHDPPSPVLSRFTLIFRVAKIGDQTDKGIELSGVECHEGEIFYAPNANFPWKRGDMHFFRLARFLLFTLIFRGKRGGGLVV